MTELSAMLGPSSDAWEQDPLVATKLYIPPPNSKFVLRPRLIQHLNEGVQGKLTLICAPAGFGKTSLLSEWCEEQVSLPGNTFSVCWVSLDAGENDPYQHASHLS